MEINNYKNYLVKILKDIVISALAYFVIFFGFENIKPGIISNYFDLNIFLIIALAACLLLILFNEERLKNNLPKVKLLFFGLFVIITLLLLLMNLPFPLYFKLIIVIILGWVIKIYYQEVKLKNNDQGN
jgi:hypothetical protein